MPGKHHLRGFKIAKKIGSPLRGSWTMVSIALVDARKTSLTGVQNSNKKNRLAASRLVDDGLHCVSRCQQKHHLRGFKIAKKIGSPLRGSWTMVSIALVDARKTSLMGVQNSKKNRLAATRLVDDAPHRRWVKPPPWKKARSAPGHYNTGELLKEIPPYLKHGFWYKRSKYLKLITLPQKNGSRIKTPSSKSLILVSFCRKKCSTN